jgi:hypothetical protein
MRVTLARPPTSTDITRQHQERNPRGIPLRSVTGSGEWGEYCNLAVARRLDVLEASSRNVGPNGTFGSRWCGSVPDGVGFATPRLDNTSKSSGMRATRYIGTKTPARTSSSSGSVHPEEASVRKSPHPPQRGHGGSY